MSKESQPVVALGVVLRECDAVPLPWRPASAPWHASSLAVEGKQDDVPAEIGEFLVDTLESHGVLWMWWVWWCGAVWCGVVV